MFYKKFKFKLTVLRFRICFIVDPEPAFFLNSAPDPGSQTNADPVCRHKKLDFYMKKYFM